MDAIGHAPLRTGPASGGATMAGEKAKSRNGAERAKAGGGRFFEELRVMRIGLAGLEIVLGLVVGIGNPPVHELDPGGEIAQPAPTSSEV